MAGDDLFSDLGISKPKNTSHTGSPYDPAKEDAVLATSFDSNSSLSKNAGDAATKGEPMRKGVATLRDATANAMDVAVSAALDRSMRRIMPKLEEFMEDTTRRLQNIESRCEVIDQAIVDLREVSSVRDETVKERLQGIERQLREISRGVQLVRDKQELQEVQAELVKLTVQRDSHTAVEPAPTPEPPTAPAPTPPVQAPVVTSSRELPAAEAVEIPTPAAAATTASAPAPSAPPAAPAAHVTTPAAVEAALPALPSKTSEPDPALIKAAVEAALAAARQNQQQGPPQPSSSNHVAPSAPMQQPAAPIPMHAPPPPPPPPMGPSGAPGGPPAPNVSSGHYQSAAMPPPPPPQQPLQVQQHYGGPPPPPHMQMPGVSPQSGRGPPPPPAVASQPAPIPGNLGFRHMPDYPVSQSAPPGGLQGGIYGPPPPTMVPQYGARPHAPPPAPRMGGPPGPPAPQRSYSSTSSTGPPGTSTKTMSVQQVVNEVSSMGFAPYQVRQVIDEMLGNNQNIDLNVVIDRLTNGPR